MTLPVRPAPARPVLVLGVLCAVLAGLLAAVAHTDRWVLATLLLVIQLGFVLAWASLLDTPGVVGAVAIGAGAAAASDGLLLSAHSVPLPVFAVIVALAFLLALLWQIASPARTRVTEALAATLAAVVFAVGGAALLTLRSVHGGPPVVVAALLGVAAALGLARLVDAFWARPAVLRRRGVPGLVVGLAAAAAVGAGYGSAQPHSASVDGLFYGTLLRGLGGGTGALVALVAAAVALAVDLGVEAGLATLTAEPPRRRAPWPARLVVSATLPLLLAAPPVWVVAKVVLT